MESNKIVLYQTDDGQTQLHVRFGDDTVWLTQAQMAELFQRDQSVIARHIQNVYEEGELELESTMQKMHSAGSDKPVAFYNLDVIISVGYRVKSLRGTQFRRWATTQLREFLVKGFLLNDRRFKELGGDRYFEELLQRIRDIRSSEKVFWKKVLEIYATSVDYDKDAEITRQFFATVQNKMHWAAHGHTAAEIIVQRADARKPRMGMTNYPGNLPLKSDAKVAKNYLNEEELNALNLIVSLYLDFAELQTLNRRQMTMRDWVTKLDEFLKLSERDILAHAGTVSREEAERKAELEYERWRALEAQQENAVERHFRQAIEAANKLEKKKPKKKP